MSFIILVGISKTTSGEAHLGTIAEQGLDNCSARSSRNSVLWVSTHYDCLTQEQVLIMGILLELSDSATHAVGVDVDVVRVFKFTQCSMCIYHFLKSLTFLYHFLKMIPAGIVVITLRLGKDTVKLHYGGTI